MEVAKVGILAFFLDLKKKLSIMLAMGISYMAFIMLSAFYRLFIDSFLS